MINKMVLVNFLNQWMVFRQSNFYKDLLYGIFLLDEKFVSISINLHQMGLNINIIM